MKIIYSITEAIGNTPLLKLQKLSKACNANIYAKCEFFNPTNSVKDRIALGMIEDALQNGIITENSILIEPTSGNTGIGLASVCAAKGIKLILTMPESMSLERRKLMQALGAELVLTPKELGMKGAVKRAEELHASTPNSIILQQFQNPSNPKAHREHTALEILDALENKVDIFISAVGTGGTLSGVGSVLKQRNPNARIIAVEPINSAVLSGEEPGPHKIQGIGAGFIPDTLDRELVDTILKVDVEWAYKESREIAKHEGILVGISSGANLWAAREVAKDNPGANIVTILCDTGERYLSTELYE